MGLFPTLVAIVISIALSIGGLFQTNSISNQQKILEQKQTVETNNFQNLVTGLKPIIEYIERIGLKVGVGIERTNSEVLGSPDDRLRYLGGQKYRLGGAGASTSDTTLTLQSFTLPVSGTEIAMSDFGGDIGYATLDPGTSRQEFISFTGVTQSGSDTTATLTGVTRGLSPNYPYTTNTATYAKTHAGGSIVIISNPPQLYDNFTAKTNKETIDNTWTFNTPFVLLASSTPYFTSLPTISSSTQLTTKDYVDGVALTGAPVAATSTQGISGVVRLAEPIEMASSSIYAVHGTTSPLVIGTMYSTADPVGLAENATNTHYAVITQGDLTINPQFFATSSQDAYRWGGLATFGEGINFQGFGIGTDTPGTWNSLAVAGNVLITGTTTTSGIIATTTALTIAGIPWEWAGADGASGTQLTTNGAGQLSFQAPSTSKYLESYVWEPPGAATTSVENLYDTNTVGNFTIFTLTAPMKPVSTSFIVSAVGASGDVDVGIYSEDGNTLYFQGTSGTISATGLVTVTFTNPVVLDPGNYYWAIITNSTASITVRGVNVNNIIGGNESGQANSLYSVTGQPNWCVRITGLSAGTLPSTFDETTTGGSSCDGFRLDN